MLIVPLIAVPSQTVVTVLGGQACTIDVYQKNSGMYVDLYVNSVIVVGGVIAQNLNKIVRYAYFGFTGDLSFADSQGNTDPYYLGLGTDGRYQLSYLTTAEAALL